LRAGRPGDQIGTVQATTDRADVIHFAGRHRLSPAVRDGVPALVPPGDQAGRCGWAELFAAVRARDLALVFEPDDPASARFVARAEAARLGSARPPRAS
jgi:hypothetical protein